MKLRKAYQIAMFVAVCILINYFGKSIATSMQLPLWLDSFGTVLAAYVLGPVCGAIVGLTNNIIYGFQDPIAYLYGLTSIAIGIAAGLFAKRKYFEDVFHTLSASVVVTLISVVISSAFNICFYNGNTGNLWGDGAILYLQERNFPSIIAYFTGEFYVDFLDKCIILIALYLLIRVVRFYRNKKLHKSVLHSLMFILILTGVFGFARPVDAKEAEDDSGNYVQTVYNRDNGLPCGTANTVVQTNDGILWIGTYAGLYRYNGSEIVRVDEFDTVKNVNCLYVDEEGRLWIGTNDNGLAICINGKLANVVDEDDGLPSNSVRSIVQGAQGQYYVGTTDEMQIVSLSGGLNLYNTIDEIHYAVSLTADESGNVCAVDSQGCLYLIQDEKVARKVEINSESRQYTCAKFGSDGLLYCGTSANNLEIFEVADNTLKKKSVRFCSTLQYLNSIYFDEDGKLFVCADNGVGYLDDDNEFVMISTGGFNNSIDNMTMDYQGNMWFASSRMGLLRLCSSNITNFYKMAGMENKMVNSMTRYQDDLYVGTDSGLDIIDTEEMNPVFNELTEALDGTRIRCVKTDANGSLWICTYGKGVWEVTDQEIYEYNSQNSSVGDWARLVLPLSDGTVAIATESGVSYIADHKETHTFTYNVDLSNTMILSLLELKDSSLLVGTDGGGMVLIKNQEVVKTYTRADSGLTSNVILRTVADEKENGVFIITSNGICYMDAKQEIRDLKNIPYYNNYDLIVSEDGRLFILGSAGIYVVNRDELLSGETINYELIDAKLGLTDSLTANSWNYIEDGYLYLSCATGVYGMAFDSYQDEAKSYRMMVSSVQLDGESYEVERGETIEIGRDVNKIEIFPEVINFTLENPYVQYYLEGFDEKKTVVLQSDLSSIVYTNLPSGNYKFHIAVLDRTQKKMLEESVYAISKEKAICDNDWFTVYMIVVLVMAVAWLTWFLMRTQIQRTLDMQRKEIAFAKRQIEMGNETILAIARTVDAKDENTSHHSLRVAEYSVMIAKECGMSDEDCENLRKIAMLHDIGKIGIPDRILNKPAKLTDEEYEIMKSHVTKGAEVLKDFTLIDHAAEGTLYHHERYDGTGYVSGLKGEEIPLNARIIGIADAFDAMTSNRVYRKKQDLGYVLGELKKGRGTQFDPKLVDILLNLIENGKINVDQLFHEVEKSGFDNQKGEEA